MSNLDSTYNTESRSVASSAIVSPWWARSADALLWAVERPRLFALAAVLTLSIQVFWRTLEVQSCQKEQLVLLKSILAILHKSDASPRTPETASIKPRSFHQKCPLLVSLPHVEPCLFWTFDGSLFAHLDLSGLTVSEGNSKGTLEILSHSELIGVQFLGTISHRSPLGSSFDDLFPIDAPWRCVGSANDQDQAQRNKDL